MKGGLEAGRKAVDLQPDLAEGHYFYGGFYYMMPELEPGRLRTSIWHVAESIRLEPRHHAGWVMLGAAAIFVGRYAEAISILTEAIRLEGTSDLRYRFVGARTLRAIAYTRRGDGDLARAEHTHAAEVLRSSSHVYATTFQTLSVCELGDMELRCGNAGAALRQYRRARSVVTESRSTLGRVRLLIRVNASLAAAYGVDGDAARAAELLDEARAALMGPGITPSTATIECSLAHLWLCVAASELRIGRRERAETALDQARECGWLDPQWLRNCPELRPLAGSAVFEGFVGELEQAQELTFPLPNFPAAHAAD